MNSKIDKEKSNNEDVILVRESLRGDKESFERLINKYKKVIFNLAYRLSGDSSEAEDIVQESFIRVYKNIHLFKLTEEFYSWLYTISVNVCRNHYRKKKFKFFSLSKPINGKNGEFNFEYPENSAGPEQELIRKEELKKARELLETLPFKYRSVFVLRYVENMSYHEIAKMLDIPLGTVKTYLHRGQRVLCKKFSKKNSAES